MRRGYIKSAMSEEYLLTFAAHPRDTLRVVNPRIQFVVPLREVLIAGPALRSLWRQEPREVKILQVELVTANRLLASCQHS